MVIMTAAPDKVDKLTSIMDAAGMQCAAIGTVTERAAGPRLARDGEIVDMPYYAVDELTKIL